MKNFTFIYGAGFLVTLFIFHFHNDFQDKQDEFVAIPPTPVDCDKATGLAKVVLFGGSI